METGSASGVKSLKNEKINSKGRNAAAVTIYEIENSVCWSIDLSWRESRFQRDVLAKEKNRVIY